MVWLWRDYSTVSNIPYLYSNIYPLPITCSSSGAEVLPRVNFELISTHEQASQCITYNLNIYTEIPKGARWVPEDGEHRR